MCYLKNDNSINKLKYPLIIAIDSKVKVINIDFLIFFLSLNKNTKPKPALEINPAKVAENVRISETYKSLIITLEAQLGIKPTRPDSSGVKYTLLFKKSLMLASPT